MRKKHIFMISAEFHQNIYHGQYFCGMLPGVSQKKDSMIK